MVCLPKTLLLLGSLESKTSAQEAELDIARWLQVFDRETLSELAPAFVVGGAVLRLLVPGGRLPRDLDVQHAGSPEAAADLQARLRAAGIPANVRSLQTPGTRDVMTMAAGWRRILYGRGRLTLDPLAARFVLERVATIVGGLPDTHLARRSAEYVLAEYPGASVVEI